MKISDFTVCRLHISQIVWKIPFLFHKQIVLSCRRKFRSQTSDLWTDAATGLTRTREEKVVETRLREAAEAAGWEPSGGSSIARGCGTKQIWHAKVHRLQRETLWPWVVEKVHAAAARRSVGSQDVKDYAVGGLHCQKTELLCNCQLTFSQPRWKEHRTIVLQEKHETCFLLYSYLYLFPRRENADNPLCQLLPMIGNRGCRGMAEEGDTKEVVECNARCFEALYCGLRFGRKPWLQIVVEW